MRRPSRLLAVLSGLWMSVAGGGHLDAGEESGESPAAVRGTVAAILERPVERLRVLDRRTLALAFVEGRYAIVVVRDLETDETLEVAFDVDRELPVDPTRLRQRDRERAAVEGRKLQPDLRELVLRHPELEEVEVQLRLVPPEMNGRLQLLEAELQRLEVEATWRQLPSGADPVAAILSAQGIVRLASSPLIEEMELLGDPEIVDGDG